MYALELVILVLMIDLQIVVKYILLSDYTLSLCLRTTVVKTNCGVILSLVKSRPMTCQRLFATMYWQNKAKALHLSAKFVIITKSTTPRVQDFCHAEH